MHFLTANTVTTTVLWRTMIDFPAVTLEETVSGTV